MRNRHFLTNNKLNLKCYNDIPFISNIETLILCYMKYNTLYLPLKELCICINFDSTDIEFMLKVKLYGIKRKILQSTLMNGDA